MIGNMRVLLLRSLYDTAALILPDLLTVKQKARAGHCCPARASAVGADRIKKRHG
jgi:hypothetical protein